MYVIYFEPLFLTVLCTAYLYVSTILYFYYNHSYLYLQKTKTRQNHVQLKRTVTCLEKNNKKMSIGEVAKLFNQESFDAVDEIDRVISNLYSDILFLLTCFLLSARPI